MLLHKRTKHKQSGYMLIEILVSLGIFSIIVVTTTAALLSIMAANAKAQALRSVIDNLNASIESMSRSIRLGTDYECYSDINGVGSTLNSVCGAGTIAISFLPQDAQDANDRVFLYFKEDTDTNGKTYGAIYRERANGPDGNVVMPITSPEVDVLNARFYLIGASHDDGQPRIVIAIRGRAGQVKASMSSFVIQTTVAERLPDCNGTDCTP